MANPRCPPVSPTSPTPIRDAPKGGRIVVGLQGTYDSLNPLIVLGVAPDVVPRYVLQSLMLRSLDEPFTVYGLIATSVEMPEDRSSVVFNLDPRARFSDGHPLTAEDVRFTFDLLKQYGKPFHRSSFGQVKSVEIPDPHQIRFDLSGANDRELPLIIATMPIFAAHATDPATVQHHDARAAHRLRALHDQRGQTGRARRPAKTPRLLGRGPSDRQRVVQFPRGPVRILQRCQYFIRSI